MAPHDSDSSGDEQEDYTETNVLLGYASKEPEDISHLGGRPVSNFTQVLFPITSSTFPSFALHRIILPPRHPTPHTAHSTHISDHLASDYPLYMDVFYGCGRMLKSR